MIYRIIDETIYFTPRGRRPNRAVSNVNERNGTISVPHGDDFATGLPLDGLYSAMIPEREHAKQRV
jgi:hypothetical protein